MYQWGIVCGKILYTYFREAYFQLFNIKLGGIFSYE